MKKYILLSLMICPMIGFSQLKELETASSIEQVTVFFNGAQVQRKASLNLNPGTNIIRLSRLSPYIDPNSVQIEGSTKYTIVSVNQRKNYLNETEVSPELTKLKSQMENLQFEFELLKTETARLEEEKSFIDQNKVITGQNKTLTVDDVMDMSELYQSTYKEIFVQQLELSKKEKELLKNIKKLRMQYDEINNKILRNTTEVIVNISAATRMTTDIRFTYVVSNASWTPSYDAKAVDTKSPFNLTYKAKLVQTTGEDWKNVHLVLSTGNPSKNNTLPNLYTWELSGYDYALAEKKRKEAEERANRDYNKKNQRYDNAGAPAPSMKSTDESVVADGYTNIATLSTSTTTANYTVVTQTSVNTEFDISIPYTVMSDGKDYSVEIKQVNLDAIYRYYAAPKYDKTAFLISYITGWDKLNLISGMANVYFQDSYVGQSWLETQVTLDSLPLSLGRDRSVVVERTKLKDYSKPSIVGGNKKVTIAIELIVKNTKNVNVLLDLEDQIPVSRNKEIEVELTDAAGAVLNAETGSLFWILDLKPGENKKITFVYTVKFPKDKELDTF